MAIYPGIGAALAAAFLFGLATSLAKGLLSRIDPRMLAGLLFWRRGWTSASVGA